MSSATISALFSSDDVLDKCEMKPWWERIRTFILFLTFAVEIFLVFDVGHSSTVDCISQNDSVVLSTAETKYWNGICASQIPWWAANLRFLNLIFGIFTFGIYALWPVIPRVQQTFETVRKCDKIVSDLKLSSEDIEDVVHSICATFGHSGKRLIVTEEHASTITAVCIDLWTTRSRFPISVKTLYYIRHIVASIPISLSIYSLIVTVAGETDNSTFVCDHLKKYDMQLLCFHGKQRQLTTLLWALIVLQIYLLLCNVIIVLCFWPNSMTFRSFKASLPYLLNCILAFIMIILAAISGTSLGLPCEKVVHVVSTASAICSVLQLTINWILLQGTRRLYHLSGILAFIMITLAVISETLGRCETAVHVVRTASVICSLLQLTINLMLLKGTSNRSGTHKSWPNESDNEFARYFADVSHPLHTSTRKILSPKNMGLQNIELVTKMLKSKTFSHLDEKTFADLRDLVKREITTETINMIVEKHKELLGDERAEEKLRKQPDYCGCNVFFRSNSLYDNVLQNSPEESLFEHLLKQMNADDKFLNHVITAGCVDDDNLHNHLIAKFQTSERARRAIESRVRETPAWLQIRRMYNRLNEMCKISLRNKDFDAFVFAHYLMSIENGDGSCSCDTILQDIRLDNVDQRDRSLMYYLLADFGRFQERPRLHLIEHILTKLQQPTALKITKTVYWYRNETTIYQFLDLSYTGDQHRKLKKILDEATIKINPEEIKKACTEAIRETNYKKFNDFHCQVTMKEFPCRFCDKELKNMRKSTHSRIMLEQIRKSDPNVTNDSISHIFKAFGFEDIPFEGCMILGNEKDEIIRLNRNGDPEIFHTDEEYTYAGILEYIFDDYINAYDDQIP